jgi:hypothetical protein
MLSVKTEPFNLEDRPFRGGLNMLDRVAVFALVMCALNWLLFVAITFRNDLPELKNISEQRAALDPGKLAEATGSLAGAFKKAGPAPTAAALSVLCLMVAVIAAGVDKL